MGDARQQQSRCRRQRNQRRKLARAKHAASQRATTADLGSVDRSFDGSEHEDTYAGTDASAAATTTEPAARVHCSDVAVTKPCERVCGAQGATTTTESGCDKMPTLSIRADGGKVQSGDYAAIHGLPCVSTMSWNAADGSGSKGAAAIAKGNGSD